MKTIFCNSTSHIKMPVAKWVGCLSTANSSWVTTKRRFERLLAYKEIKGKRKI